AVVTGGLAEGVLGDDPVVGGRARSEAGDRRAEAAGQALVAGDRVGGYRGPRAVASGRSVLEVVGRLVTVRVDRPVQGRDGLAEAGGGAGFNIRRDSRGGEGNGGRGDGDAFSRVFRHHPNQIFEVRE